MTETEYTQDILEKAERLAKAADESNGENLVDTWLDIVSGFWGKKDTP